MSSYFYASFANLGFEIVVASIRCYSHYRYCLISNLFSPRIYFLYAVFKVLCSRSKEQLVGSSGLEPPTSRLSGARSNHLSYEPIFTVVNSAVLTCSLGGDDGIRTHDPLLAGLVLSQLSYTPGCVLLILRSFKIEQQI